MNILLVENSKTLVTLISNVLEQQFDVQVFWAQSKAQVIEIIEEQGHDFFEIAITNLNVEDADGTEIVGCVTEFQIPTLIFTSTFDEKVRASLLKTPGVVDYVVKENQMAIRYLCNMVNRLINNRHIKTLVVDDSRAIRLHVCELLRQYQFQVYEAANGEEALKVIEENRDIKLVVTDYKMTEMDGFDLTKKLRATYEKEEMAIIGFSGSDNPTLAPRFIKSGANDFIRKPFEPEEFYCRVTQNIDLIEKTQALVDMATKDFLTKLHNRRFFFEKGVGKLRNGFRKKQQMALAMLDIDHFKSVNDTFGHDVGDEVLKTVSQIIRDTVRPDDLVARMGGEEFCVLLSDITRNELADLFEKVRANIAAHEFASLKERKFVTSSFGVMLAEGNEDLDTLVKRADELLYNAKETGRNKVTLSD